MSAAELAQILHARRIGRGKWQAKCPAHPDRHPSLSIAEGRKVPVVLRCMSAGCDTRDILAALGLRWSDLFPTSPRLTEREMWQLEAQRRAEALDEQRKRAQIRWWIRKSVFWRAQVEGLGKALMQKPENDKMARQFHQAVERRRVAQAMIRPYFHRAFVGDADL